MYIWVLLPVCLSLSYAQRRSRLPDVERSEELRERSHDARRNYEYSGHRNTNGNPTDVITRRLGHKYPFTEDHIRKASAPERRCTDMHICCSKAFPTAAHCSEEDSLICPKSCGKCRSTGCVDRSDECDKSQCSDPKISHYSKAQCPVTCGSCGKNGTLGFTCKVCNDTLPNCQKLADDGLCEPTYAELCRKSCGCFGPQKSTNIHDISEAT